ncbi:hypothetical protein C8046_11910 [Serinibacter arcticus]|uniref:Uncharacterized protein n=1 Tax=Serinibacter arcticus TaxID=1655435 RepID=A0A2U1ZWA6_9MICO|nr:hypothetical protein [Serinibacter arcticus]PWD51254.1 hypothetical protein C8046_11910 [Serinibacter arcticus]
MTPLSRRSRALPLVIAASGLILVAGCGAPAASESTATSPGGALDSPSPHVDPSGYVPFDTDLSLEEAQARVESNGLTDDVIGYRFESDA